MGIKKSTRSRKFLIGTDMTNDKTKRIRREALELGIAKSLPHIAPALSIVEILIAIYDGVLKENDKFILSKGHGCLSLYPILQERGLCPTISGHPDIESCQGIECSTGSLGHGLPIGTGMALASKLQKIKRNIYVLMSDGECQEGTTWESLLIASHHKLNNLIIIVDNNKMQTLGKIDDILSLSNLNEKFAAFNCNCIEVDGHSIPEIIQALRQESKDRPKVIIAHTIKGKGISFMENVPMWHNRLPNEEELKIAYKELE